MMVQEMELESAKPVGAPGENEKKWEIEENDVELEGDEVTKYRRTAARGKYLGADRTDIQYAVKEVCRGMAKPTVGHKRKRKRVARYLRGRQRVV